MALEKLTTANFIPSYEKIRHLVQYPDFIIIYFQWKLDIISNHSGTYGV